MPTLSDYAALYEKLAIELAMEPWYGKEWKTTSGFFPNAETPKSVFIQLFRDTWFNEEGKGIHLESWMTNADVARGTVTVVLHIESSKERTGINGKLLVKNILAAVGDRIEAWEGYQTKESYTMQPITGKLAITPETFSKTLRHEFNRLAGLADTIDAAIVVARS